MAEINPHFRDHDPLVDMHHCDICGTAVRRVLNNIMPEMDLGPDGGEMLIRQLRRLAIGLEPVPNRLIEDVVAPQFEEINTSFLVPDLAPEFEEMPDADIDIPLPPR